MTRPQLAGIPTQEDFSVLRILHDPNPSQLGDSVEAFLQQLGGPVAIFLSGKEGGGKQGRATRGVCTLLHGNEPSGVRALYRYLRSGEQPLQNALFIIASVEAALRPPMFTHRMLPGKRDLNRCFRMPFTDEQGVLAAEILRLIHQVGPEALIDIHNTSGSGPAFGVSIKDDANHRALTSLFTNDLIVTDLRLGALMELSEQNVLTVTIECGGAADNPSQIIADEGLHRYLSTESVLAAPSLEYPVNIFLNPIRLETKGQARVAYAEEPDPEAVITMSRQSEKFNYGMLTKDEQIGYLGANGFSALTAKDHRGNECLEDYFEARDGGLYPRFPIKVFMVTTNESIARSDCLFYFVSPKSAHR